MTESGKRKSGGAKTARSETVTVRLEPRVRYLAELAARVQRRTLSSYIETVVTDSLKTVRLDEKYGPTMEEAAAFLWDDDDKSRLMRLDHYARNLMTVEERQAASSTTGAWTPPDESFGRELLQRHPGILDDPVALWLGFNIVKDRVASLTPEQVDALIEGHDKTILKLKKMKAASSTNAAGATKKR